MSLASCFPILSSYPCYFHPLLLLSTSFSPLLSSSFSLFLLHLPLSLNSSSHLLCLPSGKVTAGWQPLLDAPASPRLVLSMILSPWSATKTDSLSSSFKPGVPSGSQIAKALVPSMGTNGEYLTGTACWAAYLRLSQSPAPASPTCHLGWHFPFLSLENRPSAQGQINSNLQVPLGETQPSNRASPGGSVVKNPLPMQETWVWSLGGEDPLEKEMATHSSILAWEIT